MRNIVQMGGKYIDVLTGQDATAEQIAEVIAESERTAKEDAIHNQEDIEKSKQWHQQYDTPMNEFFSEWIEAPEEDDLKSLIFANEEELIYALSTVIFRGLGSDEVIDEVKQKFPTLWRPAVNGYKRGHYHR